MLKVTTTITDLAEISKKLLCFMMGAAEDWIDVWIKWNIGTKWINRFPVKEISDMKWIKES